MWWVTLTWAAEPEEIVVYLNTGRLRQLEPNERPDLGSTRQVAWPGREMEGLEPWVDLQ